LLPGGLTASDLASALRWLASDLNHVTFILVCTRSFIVEILFPLGILFSLPSLHVVDLEGDEVKMRLRRRVVLLLRVPRSQLLEALLHQELRELALRGSLVIFLSCGGLAFVFDS